MASDLFGSVSREAAYDLCEELRPASTRLLALAKLVLGEPGARELVAKHPAVTIDGCRRMCAARMVRESGGTVAHEMAVLEVLMSQPEQVFSCRQLVQLAWHYDVEEWEAQSMVRPHIFRLRRKIEIDPDNPSCIKTIRGRGYLFSPGR